MVNTRIVTGIILSGGKSSRMGTEKGLVKHKGKALIEYSIEALLPICDQLVISSNKDCYDYLNLPVIADELKECGPIGGIYSCMHSVKSDIYLVLSCDVPNVLSELFKDLLNEIGEENLICPIDGNGRRQPLIAAYSSSCFPIIESELIKGNFKMMKLIDLLNPRLFSITDELSYYTSKLLSNVNSPIDIRSLEE